MHAGTGIRAVGAVGFALVGWQVGSLLGDGSHQPRNAILGIAIGAVSGFAVAPYVVGKPYSLARGRLRRLPLAQLVSAIIGLILGLVVAALLAYPLSFLPWSLGHLLPALAAVVCGYLGISLMLMRHGELSHLLRARPWPPAASEAS